MSMVPLDFVFYNVLLKLVEALITTRWPGVLVVFEGRLCIISEIIGSLKAVLIAFLADMGKVGGHWRTSFLAT